MHNFEIINIQGVFFSLVGKARAGAIEFDNYVEIFHSIVFIQMGKK